MSPTAGVTNAGPTVSTRSRMTNGGVCSPAARCAGRSAGFRRMGADVVRFMILTALIVSAVLVAWLADVPLLVLFLFVLAVAVCWPWLKGDVK